MAASTGRELVEFLKATGSGENKLKPAREVIKQNPDASAKECFDAIDAEFGDWKSQEAIPPTRRFSPHTIDKAKAFLESPAKARARFLPSESANAMGLAQGLDMSSATNSEVAKLKQTIEEQAKQIADLQKQVDALKAPSVPAPKPKDK